MKTSISLSRQFETFVTGLTFIIMTSIFFASCTKEDMQQPDQSQSAAVNERQANQMAAPVASKMVFRSIQIDHISMMSDLPDYKIIMNADGSGFYQGRKNVRVIGSREFQMSKKTIAFINSLCIKFNASFIDIKNEEEKIMCKSMITTTYAPNDDGPAKMFRDFDDGTPENLVAFRTAVEKAIGIDKYIKINAGDIQVSSVK